MEIRKVIDNWCDNELNYKYTVSEISRVRLAKRISDNIPNIGCGELFAASKVGKEEKCGEGRICWKCSQSDTSTKKEDQDGK